MKVRDIMTKDVVSCPKGADVATAGRLMQQAHCGLIPVVDTQGHVAGVLTDRDIALTAATRHRDAWHIGVHEAMTSKVRSCFLEDEVSAALEQMENAHVRRLPVLDAGTHLAGILSIDDIAARAVNQKDGVTPARFADAFRRICAQTAAGVED